MSSWITNLFTVRRNNRIFPILFLIFGIALPFLLVNRVSYYFRDDVTDFYLWANCWPENIYLMCKKIAVYPVPGVAVSAGFFHAIMSIFRVTDRNTLDSIFRYYLAFFDSCNFFLFIYLASLLKFSLPVLVGLIILIVPSTLIGSSIWGQIDGISLFICLLSIISFFKSWPTIKAGSQSQTAWKSLAWLLFGTLNLSIYLLLKQSAIFSIPFFFFLFLVTSWKFWKSFQYKSLGFLFLSLLLFACLFSYLDTLVRVPAQFGNSSYWFVWQWGKEQADRIATNGFNFWLLTGRGEWENSHTPLLTFDVGRKIQVDPYHTGILVYALLIVFWFISGFKSVWQIFKRTMRSGHQDDVDTYLMAFLCFFLGICHLGFNVLLTGTHERYLYTGYPFLLISIVWFCINRIVVSWWLTLLCFFAASAYGCFVFSFIHQLYSTISILHKAKVLSLIHFCLLLLLSIVWIKLCYGYSFKTYIDRRFEK